MANIYEKDGKTWVHYDIALDGNPAGEDKSLDRPTDAELIALAALANIEAVQMAGDNQQRAHQGYSPAYVTGMGWGIAGERLYDELHKRGILP